MNISSLSLIAFFSALNFFLPEQALVQSPKQEEVLANSSYQEQETTVFLSSENLNEPHYLRVKGSGDLSYLSGSISCNGRIIQLLGNQTTQINLSPYLTQGQNDVAITGQYSPVTTSIAIELIGPDNQVTQSTSGNGALNQNILVDVQ